MDSQPPLGRAEPLELAALSGVGEALPSFSVPEVPFPGVPGSSASHL